MDYLVIKDLYVTTRATRNSPTSPVRTSERKFRKLLCQRKVAKNNQNIIFQGWQTVMFLCKYLFQRFLPVLFPSILLLNSPRTLAVFSICERSLSFADLNLHRAELTELLFWLLVTLKRRLILIVFNINSINIILSIHI
jgi:hypothetical protein